MALPHIQARRFFHLIGQLSACTRLRKPARRHRVLLLAIVTALALAGLSAAPARPALAATRSYKIVYVLNGGTQPKGQVRKLKRGRKLRVSKLKKPTRTGYTFKGWYTNKGLTKRAKVVQGVSKASRRRLYAKWQAKEYAITYATDGGALPASCAKTYRVTTTRALPTPTRAGYSFVGWYRDAALTSPIDGIKKGSTGKLALYARWQERFFIAHRGYHVGLAENSIDAFRAAAERGFRHVEADVRFTSDGVAVLAHDSTIAVWEPVATGSEDPEQDAREGVPNDRMLQSDPVASPDPDGQGLVEASESDDHVELVDADGYVEILEGEEDRTGSGRPSEDMLPPDRAAQGGTDEPGPVGDDTEPERVKTTWRLSEHTYQELCEASLVEDANHPSGPDGANVSTFDQLLETCAELGLNLRIDVKAGDRQQIAGLVDAVRASGLSGTASWCTGSLTILDYLSSYDTTLPLAQYMAPIKKDSLAKLQAIARRGNPMVTHTSLAALSPQAVSLCREARIPLGVYGVPDETYAKDVDPYVYELTIDGLAAERAPDTF